MAIIGEHVNMNVLIEFAIGMVVEHAGLGLRVFVGF